MFDVEQNPSFTMVRRDFCMAWIWSSNNFRVVSLISPSTSLMLSKMQMTKNPCRRTLNVIWINIKYARNEWFFAASLQIANRGSPYLRLLVSKQTSIISTYLCKEISWRKTKPKYSTYWKGMVSKLCCYFHNYWFSYKELKSFKLSRD